MSCFSHDNCLYLNWLLIRPRAMDSKQADHPIMCELVKNKKSQDSAVDACIRISKIEAFKSILLKCYSSNYDDKLLIWRIYKIIKFLKIL